MVRSHGFSLKFPMFVNQRALKLQEAILLVKRQTVEQNAEPRNKAGIVICRHTVFIMQYYMYHCFEALPISTISSFNTTDVSLRYYSNT